LGKAGRFQRKDEGKEPSLPQFEFMSGIFSGSHTGKGSKESLTILVEKEDGPVSDKEKSPPS